MTTLSQRSQNAQVKGNTLRNIKWILLCSRRPSSYWSEGVPTRLVVEDTLINARNILNSREYKTFIFWCEYLDLFMIVVLCAELPQVKSTRNKFQKVFKLFAGYMHWEQCKNFSSIFDYLRILCVFPMLFNVFWCTVSFYSSYPFVFVSRHQLNKNHMLRTFSSIVTVPILASRW